MLSNIVGILVALYGGYQLFMNGGTPQEMEFWIKSFVALLGGGGYLAYNNFSTIKGYIPGLGKEEPKTTEVKSEKEDKNVFQPQRFNIKDMEALYHLRQRCSEAKSNKGVETCAELAGIIFNLDLPKPTLSKVKELVNEKK